MRTVDVSCGMFSNVIFLSPRHIFRDSVMDSEKVNLKWLSVSDDQKKKQFKGCIIDRYINKV